jgi:hypothetical protein
VTCKEESEGYEPKKRENEKKNQTTKPRRKSNMKRQILQRKLESKNNKITR